MNCKKCGQKVFSKEICKCGEKAPNIHGKGVAANTIICTVILVLSVISLILTASLRNIVNKNLLVNTIENVNISEIEIEEDSGKKIKLDQYIYDEFIDDSRITVENVDNVLNNPFIKNFIIEKIEGYQKFALDEGEMVYITSDDIINLIDENSDLLYNEAGLNFLEPDKAELKESLSGLDAFSDFCRDYMTGWFTSGYIQTYFSIAFVNFLEVLLVIILIQWLLVYYFNGRRIFKALKKYSISVIVPSAIIFMTSILPVFFNKNGIVSALTNEIRKPFMISSGIILGVGVVLLFVSILFSGKNKINTNTAYKADETEIPVTAESTEANITDEPELAEQPSEIPYTAFAPADEKDDDSSIYSPIENKPDESETDDEKISENKAESSTSDKKVFCTKCGHENRANSSFCTQCGTKLRV